MSTRWQHPLKHSPAVSTPPLLTCLGTFLGPDSLCRMWVARAALGHCTTEATCMFIVCLCTHAHTCVHMCIYSLKQLCICQVRFIYIYRLQTHGLTDRRLQCLVRDHYGQLQAQEFETAVNKNLLVLPVENIYVHIHIVLYHGCVQESCFYRERCRHCIHMVKTCSESFTRNCSDNQSLYW